MIKQLALWQKIGLAVLFCVLMAATDYQLQHKISDMKSQIQALKKNQQESQDFLSNKKNYVFESTINVNQYITNFIFYALGKKSADLFTYFHKKKIKRVKFFHSYLPIEVVEFDIGIKSPFMPIFTLAKKLKESPFLVIWKDFSFTVTEYPQGEARLVFYTLIKKGR